MKVFSKKKYFEVDWNCTLYCRDRDTRAWVDEFDGKPVINNRCEGRKILDGWTEDVYNPVEETGNILNTCFPKGFPEPVNCRCTGLKEAPPKHPRYKIVIECNDDFTTARMFVDGYPVKGEVAKRNPADKFNWRIGAQTAFNRLWEKKKKPVKPVDKYAQLFEEKLTEFAKEETEKIFRRFDKLPPCCAEVKRLAKPGEWVKIVKKSSEENEDYKIGDVLQIVHSTNGLTGHAYYKDMRTKFLYEYEYVVLEGYKPE